MHTKLINLKEGILRDLETNKKNENNISFKITYANEMFLNGKWWTELLGVSTKMELTLEKVINNS